MARSTCRSQLNAHDELDAADLTFPSGRPLPRSGLRLVRPEIARTDSRPADAAATLHELTEDLLAGIPSPGPVLRVYARRIARLLNRLDTWEDLLDRVPSATPAGTDFLDLVARVGARRDADDLALQRGLLALDALRDRRLTIHASPVTNRRRRRERGR